MIDEFIDYLVNTFHHLSDPSSDAEIRVPKDTFENAIDLTAFT